MQKLHYKIKVTGNVQGVYFRTTIKQKAEELGITGFVRNEPDGSVYIEAEGSETALQTLLRFSHNGSERSSVHQVQYEEGSVKGYNEFEIKY